MYFFYFYFLAHIFKYVNMSEGIMVDYPYTSNYDLLTLLT